MSRGIASNNVTQVWEYCVDVFCQRPMSVDVFWNYYHCWNWFGINETWKTKYGYAVILIIDNACSACVYALTKPDVHISFPWMKHLTYRRLHSTLFTIHPSDIHMVCVLMWFVTVWYFPILPLLAQLLQPNSCHAPHRAWVTKKCSC